MPGEGSPELLRAAAENEVTQVDGIEAGGVEQIDNRLLGRGAVAGYEDDASAAGSYRILTEELGRKVTGGLDEQRAGKRPATISLDVRPPSGAGVRSGNSNGLVPSTTVRPSQSTPDTAEATAAHGTASTTIAQATASSTVPATAPSPRAATADRSESGPWLLAMTTFRPARNAVRAHAVPACPAPMTPTACSRSIAVFSAATLVTAGRFRRT